MIIFHCVAFTAFGAVCMKTSPFMSLLATTFKANLVRNQTAFVQVEESMCRFFWFLLLWGWSLCGSIRRLLKKKKDACLISVNRFLSFKLPNLSTYEISVFKLPCANSCSNFLFVKKIRKPWNRADLCNYCAHWLISVHLALWRNVFT